MGIILILSGFIFGGFFRNKKAFALFFLFLFLSALLPFVGMHVYARVTTEEFSFPLSPVESIQTFYRYAFKPPIEEETYFFKESDYYTIKLKKSIKGNNGNPLESLVLDHLVHSYADLEDPLYIEYEYIRMYEEMVRWQARKRKSLKALFLGGGGYTFPRFIEAKYPKAEIDVVEIDPEITRVVTSPRRTTAMLFWSPYFCTHTPLTERFRVALWTPVRFLETKSRVYAVPRILVKSLLVS
jgi:hypothetical protein